MAPKLMRLTVRFSPRTHALIKREAEAEGVTITQFVREAALARAYHAIGKRGDDGPEHAAILRAVRDALRDEDGRTTPRADLDG